jgi:hypothetical protein
MKMKIIFANLLFLSQFISLVVYSQQEWPPILPGTDQNNMAHLSGNDLLQVPTSVKEILQSDSNVHLQVAATAPQIDITYHQGLPNAALNGTGWSSWGDICLATDGKVYSGIGNHWKTEKGQSFIYCWDPAKQQLNKIVDLNKITAASAQDVHFSKVHAHIIEGKDKKIYFTGTLDDGGKAASPDMLKRWNSKIAGGKLFQYDPATGKTIIYADLPPARVTANLKYDINRNILYCALEGSPDGFSFAALNLAKKTWTFQSNPGVIGNDRNFMLDKNGNVYFNGIEIPQHAVLRQTAEISLNHNKDLTSMLPTSIFPGAKKAKTYTTLWKYNPKTITISPTNSYFKSEGFRSSTTETTDGYIYGTTMGGELFRYAPETDSLIILGTNFLVKGEYITVCVISTDEKYLYYLPGAHGSAGYSGTPVIQYNIHSGIAKAITFLSEPMIKHLNYAPGGTYGIKISNDGSTLFVGLNGSPPDPVRPKGLGRGFGLTSFAIIHIPPGER